MSYSALGLASLTILPSWTIPDGPQKGKKIAPSDMIVLGFIGLGRQGRSDFNSFSACPGVQVAACCDVDSIKRERFRRDVSSTRTSSKEETSMRSALKLLITGMP